MTRWGKGKIALSVRHTSRGKRTVTLLKGGTPEKERERKKD